LTSNRRKRSNQLNNHFPKEMYPILNALQDIHYTVYIFHLTVWTEIQKLYVNADEKRNCIFAFSLNYWIICFRRGILSTLIRVGPNLVLALFLRSAVKTANSCNLLCDKKFEKKRFFFCREWTKQIQL